MQDNQAQADYWSSESGLKWIAFENELDLVFGAVDKALLDWSGPRPGERVLDIGCGTGATTRTFSTRIAPNGAISAVDISVPLLDHAQAHQAEDGVNIGYYLVDAQSGQIPGAPFDLVISRFGSMFFSDPAAAFANIRTHMRPGGRIVLAAWARAKGNPWFEVPKDAAVQRLGPLDQSDPNAPGPLGFQNVDHVVATLKKAGFQSVVGETIQVYLEHPGPVERVAALASNIGPAARILKKYNGSGDDIAEITRYVTANFQIFVGEKGVRIPASLNFFSAANP
ncbi:class I SAM-dependent methyltransferase [Aestuariicoccus sp. MJ-SS9]|uniref:class I SAM-dependent methyltransferase n=1 Tax=Aestuariicoccus sp. MJ-SS9 TaxID=3079855 RepID=UPI002911E336|nr:methyltransferase domain-containing protein [Aestuariicoccus sp. MJ-SS9]MDU8914121.1 methyltransferase domain-containing protein [Aestuariicoccus sp. MJ-SS9]